MRDLILNFPKRFSEGIALARGHAVQEPFRRIITCGMGASAIPGEILSMLRTDIVVHWDYDLPAGADTKDLIVCTSWSGNTEETVSSFGQAVALGLNVIAITKGGALAERAQAAGKPLVTLPANDIPPRVGISLMTGALLALLGMSAQLPTALDSAGLEEEGKRLARIIGGKIPLIYSTYRWRKLAGFWKILFNENAKIHAFSNNFPSAAHNEIAGFSGATKDSVSVILLDDPDADVRERRMVTAVLALFDEMRYPYSIVKLSPGTSMLDTIFGSYLLALWTSYAVATNLGVDPGAAELVEKFKKLKT